VGYGGVGTKGYDYGVCGRGHGCVRGNSQVSSDVKARHRKGDREGEGERAFHEDCGCTPRLSRHRQHCTIPLPLCADGS
jgi:hypothetical protein